METREWNWQLMGRVPCVVCQKIYHIICISILFLGCSNNNLNKDQVKEFVVSHFNEQVGGKEAIANFIGNISDSIILYNLSNGWSGRPEWVNNHSKVKAEWFYEDSVVAEVKSIEMYDNIASVYGNISYYTAGIKTSWNTITVLRNLMIWPCSSTSTPTSWGKSRERPLAKHFSQ